jgi:hypothetical protein
MLSLAQIELARARQRRLQCSLDGSVARTAVTEATRTLEPVTRDPFVDDLDDPIPTESAGVDVGCAPRDWGARAAQASAHAGAGQPARGRLASPSQAIVGRPIRPRPVAPDPSGVSYASQVPDVV